MSAILRISAIVEIFVFFMDSLICGHTADGSKMCHNSRIPAMREFSVFHNAGKQPGMCDAKNGKAEKTGEMHIIIIKF